MQMDLLDHALRLMWMLVLTMWLGLASESDAPSETKRDWRSVAAVWVVGIAWVVLLLPGFNGPQLIPRWLFVRIGAFAIAALGQLFALWSRFYIGRSWDAYISLNQDRRLLVAGPYAIVRHPIYSGFMLALIGSAFMFGHLRSFVAAAMVIVAWLYKSGLEETFLIEHFGAEYEQYRLRVKRLIPYIR